ncbi:uncharacterized protein [Magallana gigas]|uniref:uncharacterized protein n=1 Tax=Magallana gigas TaxID=29159 RepID=UPI0033412700
MRRDVMKCLILCLVISQMVISTAALTTNNRILLSTAVVGTALAFSVSGDYVFSVEELALLSAGIMFLSFYNRDSATSGTSTPTCTAPDYIQDSLLGCYRLQVGALLTYDQAKLLCQADGGRLLLVNSEAEATRLQSLLMSAGIQRLWVQGTRSAVGTPYLADDGTPLPYTGPTGVLNNNEANSVRLSYESSNAQTGFVGYSTTDTLNAFICEI